MPTTVMNYFLKTVILTALIIIWATAFLPAQNRSGIIYVNGYVTDSKTNERIVGVNVYMKGTTIGTTTNKNGYYSFKVNEGNAVIVFSFIGFVTKEETVNLKNDRNLNIALAQNNEVLKEVTVTSQRKFFGNLSYGRDIPIVESKEIAKLNSTNPSDILHARIAGVWATKTSGAPGDQQKIRIRGQASFFSSAEPLYIIDGVPVPVVNLYSLGISDLNMHDIESVTVLKDASSSAIYGYQGSNGVILIDTKRRNENKIEFTHRTGIQWFNNFYDLMNTKDYIESLQLEKANFKVSPIKTVPPYNINLCDNNRQEQIFTKGLVQEYNLAGSGRLKKTNYYLSGNYTDHKGVVIGSEQEKYNFTTRLGTKLTDKLVIDFSYRWSHQKNTNNQNEYMGNQLIFEGITKSPCLDSIPESLLYTYENGGKKLNNRMQVEYPYLNALTTLGSLLKSIQTYTYTSNAASLMARYQIFENLNFNMVESFMQRNSVFNTDSWYNVIYRQFYSPYKINLQSNESVVLLNHQANLNYDKAIHKHHLNFLLANRYYTDNISWKMDPFLFIPYGYQLKNSMAGYSSNGSVIRQMTSYIGHFSYNYNETYFLSAIANYSRLKEGLHIDYYTLFPSGSLSWDIAHENFMNRIRWIDQLCLYSNYGVSGNYPLNGLSNDLYMYYMHITDSKSFVMVKQFANYNLKHESNTELDLGIKTSFFNNRLNLNASTFNKNIGNQILLRDIPLYYGGGKMYTNIGNVKVNGVELELIATVVKQRNINWTIRGNFTKSNQKVTHLNDNQPMEFASTDLLFPKFIIKENEPMGNIYGYKFLGKFTDEDKNKMDVHYVSSNPRGIGFKYLNADTLVRSISEKDKVIIGNSIPKFNWNFMSSFQYKEFSLDMVIYSSWGYQKYNATRAATYISGVDRELNNFYSDNLMGIRDYQFYESSYFIEDASFIRLKTVTFNYYPKKRLCGVNYNLALSFENFYTFTRYQGYDPEATTYTDNNFSDNAIDRGAYPNPKSVYFTININL